MALRIIHIVSADGTEYVLTFLTESEDDEAEDLLLAVESGECNYPTARPV